jgi:uncharacterized membrane protein (Fun14 family)
VQQALPGVQEEAAELDLVRLVIRQQRPQARAMLAGWELRHLIMVLVVAVVLGLLELMGLQQARVVTVVQERFQQFQVVPCIMLVVAADHLIQQLHHCLVQAELVVGEQVEPQ